MSSNCIIRFSNEEINNKKEDFNKEYPNHTLLEKLEVLEKHKHDYSLEGVLYHQFKDELIKQQCNKVLEVLKGVSAEEANSVLYFVKEEIKSKQNNIIL
jgi:hypothetical protein